MKPLPKNYDHKEAEPRLQKLWEESGVYAWDESQPRENTFIIDTPPPTVSGILHMGHIFSYTQADFVARYQRMSGKTVFYPMGFDDNGLPTERLVEKEKKVRGSAMPREQFVALCREVVKSAEDEFRRLFKSTALSVDWKQEYQTISDDVRRLSQMSFLDLLQKGEAYRDFRPTYWDWVDQTAIAQAEIEEKLVEGIQCTIPFGIMDAAEYKKIAESSGPLNAGKSLYPTFDSLEKVAVMTTRPELLGACVALICHPDDKNRYHDKVAVSPLFNVVVPIHFDEKVDKEKGTGFVMCCSWGDDTDKEWIAKYKLAWRPLIDKDGRIRLRENGFESMVFIAGRYGDNDQQSAISYNNCFDPAKAHAAFNKLINAKLIRDIKNENSAKGRALKLLEEFSLLLPQGDTKELIIHKSQTVKCAERSGTPIEIIPTHQWFVRITDKKDVLKAKGGQCKWYPEFMHLRLDQWIDGLKEDWCISRQRFFGVPFPIWYSRRAGEEGKPLFAEANQLPIDPLVDLPKGYTREEVDGDKDVMDTWATSSVSPQINARGITRDKCVDAKRFDLLFPADLRPQAHEIIRTWAFYTIVKAYLHSEDNPDSEKQIPWKNLMISGWCLASDKSKISKSKGNNTVTPVELIADKGADVVRYWASTSRLGADTAFSEDLLKIGKKLVTKLWNATAFAAIHLSKLTAKPTTAAADVASGRITETLDKWILSRLQKTVAKATLEFARFEYCDARVAVEEFFWKDFCDNYLELVKARAYGEIGDAQAQASAHYTLYYCLNAILRLFAPFVPHVTEELFSHLFEEQGSVHARGMWPKAADYPVNEEAEKSGTYCIAVLEFVRRMKSDKKVSIKFPIIELGICSEHQTGLTPVLEDLKSAGNISNITFSPAVDSMFHTIVWGEQTDVA